MTYWAILRTAVRYACEAGGRHPRYAFWRYWRAAEARVRNARAAP